MIILKKYNKFQITGRGTIICVNMNDYPDIVFKSGDIIKAYDVYIIRAIEMKSYGDDIGLLVKIASDSDIKGGQMRVLVNEPTFDGDRFLGLLEVDLQDVIDGKYEPLTEKELLKFIYAYLPIVNKLLEERNIERKNNV